MPKNVVITGSTRGIGRGLANEFLKRDCRVAISGRSVDTVQHAVSELRATHGRDRVAGAACNITNPEQLRGLWTEAADSFGSVDVWINNAGMSITRSPLWLVNFTGLFGGVFVWLFLLWFECGGWFRVRWVWCF